MQWGDADAALAAELGLALGGVKIITVPRWGELVPGEVTDDLYFGALALTVRDSRLRMEVALNHRATVRLDAWLARRTGYASYVGVALDPALDAIEIERPSELVVDLVRRLAGAWLAAASRNAHALDDAVTWRPLEHDRRWFVRTTEIDAHLSQLWSEPIAALACFGPTPLR